MAEGTPARKASGTPVIRFEAQVQRTGGSTILRLPDDASAKLPSRGQVAVKGVVNGLAFQTVLEPDGRRGHWLRVDEKLRQALAVSEGDTVALTVEPAEGGAETGQESRSVARWTAASLVAMEITIRTKERCNG